MAQMALSPVNSLIDLVKRYIKRALITANILSLMLFSACDGYKHRYTATNIDNLPVNQQQMLKGAVEQTRYTRYYDASYVKINYPNGDVPKERGVCSDVVVRAMRSAGLDLQQAVHEDMEENFSEYPKLWNLKKPDTNIDHRRVANLMRFFERHNKSLPITNKRQDYKPGDIVTWSFEENRLHTGVVSHYKSESSGNYCIIHNFGKGARVEDVLFRWPIAGHYRYFN